MSLVGERGRKDGWNGFLISLSTTSSRLRQVHPPPCTPAFMGRSESFDARIAAAIERSDRALQGLEDSLLRLQDIHRRMDVIQGAD